MKGTFPNKKKREAAMGKRDGVPLTHSPKGKMERGKKEKRRGGK